MVLIAIVGPTGSGKSTLALKLAQQVGGEIVNCDSLQVYRHFDIGTAKLKPHEQEGVPHHLIDIVEPDQLFTAGDYAAIARPLVKEIALRGKIPIVVGGTGFYLRALFEGLSDSPTRDDNLRARLIDRERKQPESLHRILQKLDPGAATKIHANDLKKTIRALEMRLLRAAGRETLPAPDPLTGFDIVKIGLNPERATLYSRLDKRLVTMFEEGLLEEVRSLLDRGVSPKAKPFESLGYKEALQFLRGETTYEQALAQAQQYTRNYAKRQWTWFRRDPGVHWIDGFGEDPNVSEQALQIVKHH
jgi:tRNA dimethylallyltransferase